MKIYFATFGCKVNSSENDFFLAKALQSGYEKSISAETADVIVINGCAVTEKAFESVKSYISKISSKNPKAKIILTGCAAAEIENNAEKCGGMEIISNDRKNDVVNSILAASGSKGIFNEDAKFCGGLPETGSSHTRAFFKIQDGCDAFCSYCIIPSLRGAPISKPINEAVKEFEECVKKGFKEIVIVGIHIGLYGKGKGYNLNDLMKKIIKIEGDFRIRLSSIEVNEIDDELIGLMADNDKICPHLHIPLQSGSEKILKAMERKYPPEKYIETVRKAKAAIKGLNVGSDVIVGFPSENEDDFLATIDTVKKAGTDFLHVFPYSDRNGTKASFMEGKIAEKEKESRSKRLRLLADEILDNRYKKMIGKTLKVLTEKNNKGHSDNYLLVEIDNEYPIQANQFKQVKITGVKNTKLSGVLDE